MKILFISLSASPGMQRYTINICNEICNKVDTVLVCTKNYNIGEIQPNVKIHNIVSTKTPRFEIRTLNILEIKKVIRVINQEKPDIIHFLSDHPWNPILSFMLNNIKQLHTIHDPNPHPNEIVTIFKIFNNYIIINLLKKNILLHGNKYIEDTHNIKKVKGNIYVSKLATEKSSDKDFILSNEKRVLFFGRIKPYKGLDLFIKSMNRVLSFDESIKITIAGEGNIEKYINLIDDKFKQNFEIYNYNIPEEEIEKLFLGCRLVVLPYESATQSGIIPISYYYSRPVIVTNVGCLPEFVDQEKTGFIVEKKEEEIANRVLELINDENKLINYSKNAKLKLNIELSLENMINEFIDIYIKILNKGEKYDK